MEDEAQSTTGETTSDVYKAAHMEMETTVKVTPTAEVDMSGALNASAALSASAALKVIDSQNDSRVVGNGTEEKEDATKYIKLVSKDLKANKDVSSEQNVNDSSSEDTNTLKKTQSQNETIVDKSSKKGEASVTIGSSFKPETFIDGIEKFVNFVSKEGLAKKMNETISAKENVTKVNDTSIEEEIVESTKKESNDETESDNSDNQKSSDKDDSSGRKTPIEDVDADLKSYALAVNDMLENEVEVAADANELDAEIKTMVVSNTDEGELKMTFTDNAVGRFETIGKGEEKGSGEPVDDGLSPVRKSSRNRKRKVYADFDQADNAELENVVDHVSKEIEQEVYKIIATPSFQSKSKRKNPSPKKAKLTVEEVYESDTNEESDGDIGKDILKVRMAKCDVCDKHFLDRKKLDEHKKRHNKKSTKSPTDYPCIVCGKNFVKREHWRRHVKIHDDVRPFACPVCKKSFRRKEHVKRHMLIHTGEKPFECDICHQYYQRADHLKKHMQQHAKDTYRERHRKGNQKSSRKTRTTTTPRRKPTTKAAKLVAVSRGVKVKEDPDEMENDHYSDGLSDDNAEGVYAE